MIGLLFSADSMVNLFIFSLWAPRNASLLQECVSAVQGHPRSLILIRIESAYATCY